MSSLHRNLVLSGLGQMMLDLVCIGLASAIRVDGELDTAMVFTTAGGLLTALLFLGTVLGLQAARLRRARLILAVRSNKNPIPSDEVAVMSPSMFTS